MSKEASQFEDGHLVSIDRQPWRLLVRFEPSGDVAGAEGGDANKRPTSVAQRPLRLISANSATAGSQHFQWTLPIRTFAYAMWWRDVMRHLILVRHFRASQALAFAFALGPLHH